MNGIQLKAELGNLSKLKGVFHSTILLRTVKIIDVIFLSSGAWVVVHRRGATGALNYLLYLVLILASP